MNNTGRPLFRTSPVRYFLANLDQFCPVFYGEGLVLSFSPVFLVKFGLVLYVLVRYFWPNLDYICPVFFLQNGLSSGIFSKNWTSPQNRPVLIVRYSGGFFVHRGQNSDHRNSKTQIKFLSKLSSICPKLRFYDTLGAH